MRKLKFRAWAKERKEFVYFDINKGTPWNINEKYIMQYTGLEDGNNKEIYEGDILESSNGGNSFKEKVHWDIDQFRVGNYEPDGLSYFSKNCKVIGNIYENPELLNN